MAAPVIKSSSPIYSNWHSDSDSDNESQDRISNAPALSRTPTIEIKEEAANARTFPRRPFFSAYQLTVQDYSDTLIPKLQALFDSLSPGQTHFQPKLLKKLLRYAAENGQKPQFRHSVTLEDRIYKLTIIDRRSFIIHPRKGQPGFKQVSNNPKSYLCYHVNGPEVLPQTEIRYLCTPIPHAAFFENENLVPTPIVKYEYPNTNGEAKTCEIHEPILPLSLYIKRINPSELSMQELLVDLKLCVGKIHDQGYTFCKAMKNHLWVQRTINNKLKVVIMNAHAASKVDSPRSKNTSRRKLFQLLKGCASEKVRRQAASRKLLLFVKKLSTNTSSIMNN